ncbi:hypothetical protein VPH35_117006 [Triticum aestivum]
MHRKNIPLFPSHFHSHMFLLPDPLSLFQSSLLSPVTPTFLPPAPNSSHQLSSLILCLELARPHLQPPPHLDSLLQPQGAPQLDSPFQPQCDLRRRLVFLLVCVLSLLGW